MSPGLRLAAESLLRELPEGSEIVVLASVRARHRAEVRSGLVFDLGLASTILGAPGLGDFVWVLAGELRVFRGYLGLDELQRLDPHAALVADEVDELAIAHARLVTQALLTPTGLKRGIDALTRALQIEACFLSPHPEPRPPSPRLNFIATPERFFLDAFELPGARPTGLLFVGGTDFGQARSEAHAVRALLAERTGVA
jgi:hypothetical protein